jgi:hypothetical protein
MPHALLGFPLKETVVFGLSVDSELDQTEKVLVPLPFAQRGLDVDLLV